MGYARRDPQRYTYADYCSWPEDARYELIDGVAYLMSPVPSVDHQTMVVEIGRQLGNALEGHSCRVLVAPADGLLPRPAQGDTETDTVVQPDVLVVCDPAKAGPKGIRGAPDWVLGVFSPASADHDQTVKLAAYERAGVPEYWLVHPLDQVVTIYRLEGEAYGRPQVRGLVGQTPIGVLPGVRVAWAPIVARLLPLAPPGLNPAQNGSLMPLFLGPCLASVLTWSRCGHRQPERTREDACLWSYECPGCRALLRPKPDDCCGYCAYGTIPCAPVQRAGWGGCGGG